MAFQPHMLEFTVWMVLAMALTTLVVMGALAVPSSSLIYHPQLWLLY